MPTNAGFARRMRKLRGDRTQRDFAKRIAISQQRLSDMERGALPSTQMLIRLNRAEKCSLDWLLLGHGEMR